jgi:glyoxylase-like metal-dependent hydrolase (beta-lactamase superfamily II)
MEPLAPDLWRLGLLGSDLINAYLAEDVLIDAGGPAAWRKILSALRPHRVAGHALTHGHFDHSGGSRGVCRALGVPLWCGAGDAHAVESGDPSSILPKRKGFPDLVQRRLGGPGHPVDRILHEGDEVGGFRVLETPGHTPGHLAYWREADGVLILGDVLFHRNPLTLRRGLREPFTFATLDPQGNRVSARKLAALEPRLICFGHGNPSRDGARFQEFVDML